MLTGYYDEKSLYLLAKQISSNLTGNEIILLHGDLGSGKTTFVKFLAKHLNINNITSPTFSILNNYSSNLFDIWHFDLYRIKSQEELYNIGFTDVLLSGLVLVEWPEISQNLIKGLKSYNMHFYHTKNQNTRFIKYPKSMLII